MENIAEYHSNVNRIAELEKALKSATVLKSRWKCKYFELAKKQGIENPISRSEEALSLIGELKHTDKPMKLISMIAKQCFLSESRVQGLWYKS